MSEQEKTDGVRVERIRGRNIRSLVEFDVQLPEAGLILVTGQNGAGKTSFGDTIPIAIKGGSKDQVRIIRNGQPELEAEVVCTGFTAKRSVTDRKNTLDVRNGDGRPVDEPQTFLDGMIGPLSLEPLDFDSMAPKKRMEFLFDLAGIRHRLTELEDRRAALAVTRRDAGVKYRDCSGKLKGLNAPAIGTPNEPLSIKELSEERNRRQGVVDQYNRLVSKRDTEVDEAADLDGEIPRLEEQLRLKKIRRADLMESIGAIQKTMDGLAVEPVKEIDEQIANIQETNAAITAATFYRKAYQEQSEAESAGREAKRQIAEVDAEKTYLLENTPFPVEGLTFLMDDVAVNGVIWTELARNERIRYTVNMGMAANPILKLIRIETGESLDDAGLRLLDQLGKDNGYQILAEYVVRDGQERHPRETVIVENGQAVNA